LEEPSSRASGKEWDEWLQKHEEKLAEIRKRAAEDDEDLRQSEVVRALGSFVSEALVLGDLVAEADSLGERSRVTYPNLASIMLLVEEGDTTVLLTEDGDAWEVLKDSGISEGSTDRGEPMCRYSRSSITGRSTTSTPISAMESRPITVSSAPPAPARTPVRASST
jgi:hypothetical protein